MANQKYRVELTIEERTELEDLLKKDHLGQEKRGRIQILLKADKGPAGGNWANKKITEAYDVSARKVERTKKQLVEEGLDTAVNRKPHLRTREKKIQGEQEAQLIAICCSEPPEGRSSWTLKLLADEMVRLEYIDSVSAETVRRTLKKMNSSLGKKKNGVSRKKKMLLLSAKWKRS